MVGQDIIDHNGSGRKRNTFGRKRVAARAFDAVVGFQSGVKERDQQKDPAKGDQQQERSRSGPFSCRLLSISPYTTMKHAMTAEQQKQRMSRVAP
jgi:hypothetical protein